MFRGACRGFVVLLVLSGLTAACSKEHEKRPEQAAGSNGVTAVVTPSGVAKTLAQMASNDVIVCVNDVALTKSQFEENVKRIVKRVSDAPNAKPGQVASMGRMAVKMAIPRFVSSQLMSQEARRSGVLNEAELKRQTADVVERMAKKAGKAVAPFLETVPGGADALLKEAEEVVLIEALVMTNVLPKVSVTDEFVAATVAAIREENAAISASNSLKIARLNELRKEIAAGADFGELADRYSECSRATEKNRGYWGRFERNELADRKMRAAVFALKPGELSEVLEDEEGFHLVKLQEYHAPVKNVKGVAVDPEAVTLAHILLKRVPSLELPLSGDLKKQLVEQMQQRALDAYIEELKLKARIVYPHGTNFWERGSGSLPQSRPSRPAARQ